MRALSVFRLSRGGVPLSEGIFCLEVPICTCLAIFLYLGSAAVAHHLQQKTEGDEREGGGSVAAECTHMFLSILQKASLIMEKDALIQSTKYQRLQDYKQSIETAQKDLESEKQMRAQQDETLAITTKRFEALQTVVAELRSMLEQSQKQLAKQTEEKLTIKSEHEKLLQQVDSDDKHREAVESTYKKLTDDLARFRFSIYFAMLYLSVTYLPIKSRM
ncbi:unnamed protein product [Toxocara canis]|uniref:Endoplasmic reticulum transmembrane protein n=1 Tax=Toxocara canis TaxID=6265 RepID=A0A183TYZ2_TOXCA|nr:unnamed protein product [Toxocara canis]